jgi:hypothetical protein
MAFINGIGIISPQNTVETAEFLTEVVSCTTDFMRCIEPVYRNYINPVQSRRMSRLIKMGITAAKLAVLDSGVNMPDAIITGTGLGSVEDTEKILAGISNDEQFLNPTPFIQSTYNTISSQVAIQLKCHNYNSTYVHRIFSFESGLIDALLQINDSTGHNILVGAIDEMTMNHLRITRRIGLWKQQPVNNFEILDNQSDGALAGEGAAFFMIGAEQSSSSYAQIQDVEILFKPEIHADLSLDLTNFLARNNLETKDVDLLLLGLNGDKQGDMLYLNFADNHFPDSTRGWYKHLCGEYHTATGFGLYVAANIIKHQKFPDMLKLSGVLSGNVRNILIYNHFRNINHTFILVKDIT